MTSFWLFTFEKLCKSTFKKYYAEKLVFLISFLLASWRSMMKIEGSESGSISQRHGSADPEPDLNPHQSVMDPQHWLKAWQFVVGYLGPWLTSLACSYLCNCVFFRSSLRYLGCTEYQELSKVCSTVSTLVPTSIFALPLQFRLLKQGWKKPGF